MIVNMKVHLCAVLTLSIFESIGLILPALGFSVEESLDNFQKCMIL